MEAAADEAARAEELEALQAMYGSELTLSPEDPSELSILVPLTLDDGGCEVVQAGADSPRAVRHLQLTLHVRLPKAYPSEEAPLFAVVSPWLDPESKGAELLSGMRELWEAIRPAPVVAAWAEHLRLEAAPAAGAGPLAIGDDEERDAAPVEGGVVVRAPAPASAAFKAVVDEDARRTGLEAGAVIARCGICMEDVLGSSCVAFAQCPHRFCRACLKVYFEEHIARGDASDIGCPECRVPLLPTEVAAAADPELAEAHERRALQSALAGMEDVTWCPLTHCQAPVVLEAGEHGGYDQLAQCPACRHAFCTLCRRTWHGYGPCTNFRQQWERADDSEKALLRDRFGEAVVAEIQSQVFIEEATQKCPGCRAAVEKNGGCNHMTCAKCRHEWCWLCREAYTADHFARGDCRQFSSDFFAEMAEALGDHELMRWPGGVGVADR